MSWIHLVGSEAVQGTVAASACRRADCHGMRVTVSYPGVPGFVLDPRVRLTRAQGSVRLRRRGPGQRERREPAAVEDQDLPGHVARSRAGQVPDGRGDVL